MGNEKAASNVTIEITTEVKYHHGESEKMFYQTEGKLYPKNNHLYMKYKESSEMGETWSVVKWDLEKIEQGISLIRQGDIKFNQIFIKNSVYTSIYQSSHIRLLMDIKTRRISFKGDKHKGTLDIAYELRVDHQIMGDYHLQIHYKESSDK